MGTNSNFLSVKAFQPFNVAMDTDNRVRGSPYTICLLVLLAKLATSHVLQGNKNKTYRGRCKRLSVSIEIKHYVDLG